MDRNIETQTHHPLRFIQFHSLPILAESITSLLMLRLGQLSEQSLENGAPGLARLFSFLALSGEYL
jgi:hypothetical protein